jgi:hypothetical protein
MTVPHSLHLSDIRSIRMKDDDLSRDRFYRIAFFLGVAALATVFGSAAWILGRTVNMAATPLPAPIPVWDQSAVRIMSDSKSDRQFSAIFRPAAATTKALSEVESSPPPGGPLADALPGVTNTLLGAPERLAPWLDETVGRTVDAVQEPVSTVTRTSSKLTQSGTIEATGKGLAQTTSNVSGGLAKTAGGIAKTTGGIAGGAVRGLGGRLGL